MGAFSRVLVGLDRHPAADGVLLARACALADAEDIEAVCASPEARQADDYLEHVCAGHGISRHRVLDGSAPDALLRYADGRADLLVVGSHGRQGARAFVASTSNAVLCATECDVLAVHLEESDESDALGALGEGAPAAGDIAPGRYERVLVAVDLSDNAFRVMEEANRVADHCRAALTICNVAPSTARTYRNKALVHLEHLADAYGVEEDDIFEVSGDVARRVHELAAVVGAGLVVVGAHPTQDLRMPGGATAHAVLRGSGFDVLAARVE